jgi:hypothetical protein
MPCRPVLHLRGMAGFRLALGKTLALAPASTI